MFAVCQIFTISSTNSHQINLRYLSPVHRIVERQNILLPLSLAMVVSSSLNRDSNLDLQIYNCLHFANPSQQLSLNEIKMFFRNNESKCCDDKASVVEFKLKSPLIWTWWCWIILDQSWKEIAFHLEYLCIVLLETVP